MFIKNSFKIFITTFIFLAVSLPLQLEAAEIEVTTDADKAT